MHTVFKRYNVPYWLDQGVLLGAVRDGKLIPNDTDIDLSLMMNFVPFLLPALKHLKTLNYEIKFEPSNIILRKNNIPITIALYVQNRDVCVNIGYPATTPWQQRFETLYSYSKFRNYTNLHGFSAKLSRWITAFPPFRWWINFTYKSFRKHILHGTTFTQATPTYYYQNFRPIQFYNLKFDVPEQTNNYLAFKYGSYWGTPAKTWDYCTQDGGAVLGTVLGEQYKKVRTL